MQRASGRKEKHKMKGENRLYGWGLLLTVFGGSGLAEVITSSRGSFMVSVVIFSVGVAMILWSYVK